MSRGRKGNPKRVIEAVIKALSKFPEGLTINRLSKESGIHPATITYHLNRGTLLNYVDEHTVGPSSRPFARLIVLKRGKNKVLGKILDEMEKDS